MNRLYIDEIGFSNWCAGKNFLGYLEKKGKKGIKYYIDFTDDEAMEFVLDESYHIHGRFLVKFAPWMFLKLIKFEKPLEVVCY